MACQMLARIHLPALGIAALPGAQSVFHLFACVQACTSEVHAAHLNVLNSNAAKALPGTEVGLATQLPCKEDRCITDTKVTRILPQPGRARQGRGNSHRQRQGQGQGRGQGQGQGRSKYGAGQQHIPCEGRGQCRPDCHGADWMPTSLGSQGIWLCLLASESSRDLIVAQPTQHDTETIQGIDFFSLIVQGLKSDTVGLGGSLDIQSNAKLAQLVQGSRRFHASKLGGRMRITDDAADWREHGAGIRHEICSLALPLV